MLNCLIVGIGGFVGAASRYLFTLLPFHRSGAFPLHTLLINLIGSFCIGMLVVAASKTSISPRLLLLLKTGVCGGFTTFSTFAPEDPHSPLSISRSACVCPSAQSCSQKRSRSSAVNRRLQASR